MWTDRVPYSCGWWWRAVYRQLDCWWCFMIDAHAWRVYYLDGSRTIPVRWSTAHALADIFFGTVRFVGRSG